MKKASNFWISLLLGAGLGATSLSAQQSEELPSTGSNKGRLAAWKDSKFGLFIHWGVYSVPAGVHQEKETPYSSEWIMRRAAIPKEEYRKYAEQFNPTEYDPAAWVSLAKQAGMKYIVVTAKHHDGFALFDSKVSDWNAVKASEAKRDLLKPLVEECRKQNMPLGFHYSQAQDWWHPGGGMSVPPWDPSQEGSFDEYFAKVSLPQIQELQDNYGPVYSFFFDTPRGMNSIRARKLREILSPEVITNDRIDRGSSGDYESFERRLPKAFFPARDWEFCMPIKESWGFKASDGPPKSAHRLQRTLSETASRGGNFLLNVGPDASGQIPLPVAQTLREVGSWVRTNAEAIYGTQRSPYHPIPWQGGCTTRELSDSEESVLYCHLFKHPKNGKLVLPGLTNLLKSAEILGANPIEFTRRGNSWELEIPFFEEPEIPVVKVVLANRISLSRPSLTQSANGKLVLSALKANLHGNDLKVERQSNSLTKNIGSWVSQASSVSWNLSLPQEASYRSTWEISCDDSASGSELVLFADDKEVGRFEVPSTGSWSQFQTVTGPELSLPAGTYALRLVPATKVGSKIINLRSLSFSKS